MPPVVFGSIRIVSKRKGGTPAEHAESILDVDRSNPVLGNPHVLRDHKDTEERARVIAAFARDFDADVAADGKMLRAAEELAQRVCNGERIALRCWCAPLPCHAEIIRKKVYQLAGLDELADGNPIAQAGLF